MPMSWSPAITGVGDPMSRHPKRKPHPHLEADHVYRALERERAPYPAELIRLAAARIVSVAIPTEPERDAFRRMALRYT